MRKCYLDHSAANPVDVRVLDAMGIPSSLAQGSIVFTLGKDNTDKDIEYLRSEFPGIVKKLREISPYEKDRDIKENSRECIAKR